MDYDLEIEFEKAEQSIEQYKGLAAYFKASADEKQRLLDLANQEHERADQLQKLLEVSQSQNVRLQLENQRLQAQVNQLASRPLNVGGDYIESANIERYLNLPPTPKRPRRSKPTITSNDSTLPLWDSNIA